ncbi:MAG TPA: HAD-IA family hydrolase [Candidatus Limnocylindria bacterium]|nr:HAD-IA family hydrolase [Candidatus Limnocylindria bacterium]
MEVTRDGTGLARPEVLFLDVGDTLIRAHPSWAGVYRQGLLEAGVDVAEKDLERALLQETQAGGWWLDETPFDPSEEKSFATVLAFDAAVLARLGHADLDESTFRRIEDAFARRSAWYVFPDVTPALEAMTSAGIRLCVISNFVWGAPELIHDLELARHFEKLVISARVGFQKPNAGIFRHALDQMSVAPESAMHVGDSYRADVLGARGVGIRAALIARGPNDPARLREEHSDPDLLVLSDLNDLLDVFEIERPVASPA